MTNSKAMQIVFANKIIVYPILSGRMFKIAYKPENGAEKVYPNTVSPGVETSGALAKTYLFLAKKIRDEG